MTPLTCLDTDLHSRFTKVEDQFFESFFNGSNALSAFVKSLASLQSTTKNAIADNTLSSRTLALSRSTASGIRVIADNFRELEPRTHNVDEKRRTDIADVFRRLSLNGPKNDARSKDKKSTAHVAKTSVKHLCQSPCSISPLSNSRHDASISPSSDSSSSSTSVSEGVYHPHVAPSYDWLIKHPHNPYPSTSTKAKISSESGVATKTINEWFINTRRRTGWTSLSKRYFNGCRALTVDCAHRVFVNKDLARPVPKDILDAFLLYKKSISLLYGGQFTCSDVVKKLDEVVKEIGQKTEDSTKVRNRSKSTRLQNREPSSEATPMESPVPPFPEKPTQSEPSDSDSGSTRNLSAYHGVKRKTSFDKHLDVDVVPHTQDDRPMKRPRQTISSATSTAFGVPPCDTPFFDARLLTNEPSDPLSTPSLLDCPLTSPQPYRKRRLSQSDGVEESLPKRARRFSPMSFKRILPDLLVNDPFATVDSTQPNQIWSTLDFNMPSAAILGEHIFGGDIDISTFNFLDSLSAPDPPVGPGTLGEPSLSSAGFDPTALESAFVREGVSADKTEVTSRRDLHFLASRESEQCTPTRTSSTPVQTFGLSSELSVFDCLPAVPNLFFDSTESSPSPTESYSSLSELHPSPFELSPYIFNPDPFPMPDALSILDGSQSPSSLNLDGPPGLPFNPSAPAISPHLLPSSDLAHNMLMADRSAKLERLRILKAERSRLAEEELRLEHELISHS